jgi:hypothetical protein
MSIRLRNCPEFKGIVEVVQPRNLQMSLTKVIEPMLEGNKVVGTLHSVRLLLSHLDQKQ